jgi:hypothetical protein
MSYDFCSVLCLIDTFTGDLVHASAFGMHVVVVNSREAAEELLEKRPKIYNDRPEVPIVDVCVL